MELNSVCQWTGFIFTLNHVVLLGKPLFSTTSTTTPENWKDHRITDDGSRYHSTRPRLPSISLNTVFEDDISGPPNSGRVATSMGQVGQVSKPEDTDRNPATLSGAVIPQDDIRIRVQTMQPRYWSEGVVPYIIEDFGLSEQRTIYNALHDMMARTCIRFVPYNGQTDYIAFVRRGCSSDVGRVGGRQDIELYPGCIRQIGDVQHEIMHALGFYHEQSRSDRDDYVTVVWDNIAPGAEEQFRIPAYPMDTFGLGYDYMSIMHYGWNAFAKIDAYPTILPKFRVRAPLGNREVMSDMDEEKVNRLYNCHYYGNSRTFRPESIPTTLLYSDLTALGAQDTVRTVLTNLMTELSRDSLTQLITQSGFINDSIRTQVTQRATVPVQHTISPRPDFHSSHFPMVQITTDPAITGAPNQADGSALYVTTQKSAEVKLPPRTTVTPVTTTQPTNATAALTHFLLTRAGTTRRVTTSAVRFSSPSVPISTNECMDNDHHGNSGDCKQIAKADLCHKQYYREYCCVTCSRLTSTRPTFTSGTTGRVLVTNDPVAISKTKSHVTADYTGHQAAETSNQYTGDLILDWLPKSFDRSAMNLQVYGNSFIPVVEHYS